MMLAILAEKKKKKKLNERCVLCSAQNNKETIYPYIWLSGFQAWEIFCLQNLESGNFFCKNPKSWALESRIQLSRLESGNIIQVPKTRNLELIQYLEYRMNNMKYGIQDYLGLPYSNYQVSFCFEFYFLSGKKEKKKSEQAKQTFKKNLSRISICLVLSIWALFSIDGFHPHGRLQCQFIGTKESVYILKKTVKLAQDILGTLTCMAVVSLFWNANMATIT